MAATAIRVVVQGQVQGVGFRDATVRRARAAGVLGWVRNGEDGTVLVHAEGGEEALEALLAFLREGPRGALVEAVDVERVKAEGHEQFAVRGVPAGAFSVVELAAPRRGFELRLEVAGDTRAWALPRGPSMDPAAKRLAVELAGASAEPAGAQWDAGLYEQGGRVPWPEALDRGHAVFVVHGEQLRGGFALQRTRRAGDQVHWLLVKRRDEHARPVTGGR
jgi:DNA ligase D-like protein (predicted 3'-phosphoesterase)